MTSVPDARAGSFTLSDIRGGTATLALRGRLDAPSVSRLWRELEVRLRRAAITVLTVDASAIESCDGAGLALLHFLSMGGMTAPGATVTVQGMRPEFSQLFGKFTATDYTACRPQPQGRKPLAAEAGNAAVAIAADLKEAVAFMGAVTSALGASLLRPKTMRWSEVWRVFEQAGVNALPIVSLISVLVGIIISFEAAGPFAVFGAQIFIANMLGLLMARELAGLMVAILLAGRSGSAFAAELGTMKVNEELNALETMGLNPVRFLVAQRVLAGILLTPLLTVYAIVVSIAGGVLIMMTMGFSLETIYRQMALSLTCTDILIGVGKGLIFGAIVAGIGCLRGLQTKQGPSAVGDSTTRAVVTSIVLVIIVDALVAVLLYYLGVGVELGI